MRNLFLRVFLAWLIAISPALAADTKITDLTADTAPYAGTEEIPVNDGGTDKKVTISGLFTGPVFAAGTATAGTWPKLTTGALLTAAAGGAVEYVEPVHYLTPDNDGGRAITNVCHFQYLNADFTGTAGTGSQQIFPTAADRITLKASTTYTFELFMSVTNGATTATKALDFSGGTASFTAIRYYAIAQNAALNATGTAQSTAHVDTSASTVILATGTTSWWIQATGGFTINASGTFFPRFAFSANPTGTVLIKRGSYMKICPIGGTADVVVGSWQ